MKKETKALIEWIKAQIRIAAKLDDSYLITTDAISTHKSLEKDAEKFLDSLPEIESHLCNGGYIQDRNGTPCCHGDEVMVMNKGLKAEEDSCSIFRLYWSASDFRFYLNQNLDPKGKPAGLHFIPCNFEKVEE